MRGDVVPVPAARNARGHEQQGRRYGVVVQSDHLMLGTVLVTPTSTSSLPAPHRPEIDLLGQRTVLLVEQTRAVTREALKPAVARLSYADLQLLDEALALVLGLDG